MCGVFGIHGHEEAANIAYLGMHALLLEVDAVGATQVLEHVAPTAPEHARVVARDHGVVGADRAVHGAAHPDLGRRHVERSFDALRIAPKKPGHLIETIRQALGSLKLSC